MKLRPARSARRALRPYLTAVTFRQHFPVTLKIIRLLYKRGFSFRRLRQVWCRLGRCSGESPVSQSRVPWWKGVGLRPIREYGGGGGIFTDYYFGEANTANKSDNQTNHTENNFFDFSENWAITIQHHQQGISSRDPGQSGGGGEKRETTIFNTTNKGLCSMSTSNFRRDKFPQRDDIAGKMKPLGVQEEE